jgi:ATP-dependent exoDNAse (exonuclease V) beta subunit
VTDAGQLDLLFTSAPRTVDEQVHAFAKNLVVRAGAGTGKTELLTSLYVHLVAGATDLGRPVSPDRIVAMTFTEKAAGEMRERIGSVLRFLASGGGGPAPRIARVVEESLAARGLPASQPDYGAALAALSSARITTIHAFGASLLRRHAVEARLDPAFEVLDDRRARQLAEEAAVATAQERLARGEEAVRSLVRDLGGLFGGSGGLVPTILALHAELAESGRPPPSLLSGSPYEDAGYDYALASACRVAGVTPADARLGMVGRAFETLVGVHERIASQPGLRKTTAERFAAAVEVAALLREEPSFGSDDRDALLGAVRRLDLALRTDAGNLSAASKVPDGRDVRDAALELWALPLRRARAEALVSLVAETERRYRREKDRISALDFSDLGRRTRDLLAARPELRRELTSGIDALLVDEFQDTNAVQRDLVYLLHAESGVGRGIPRGDQLRPRGLFVVGDRKQSIYGFRNADVAVFEAVAADIVSAGGGELTLGRSYRSVAPLVAALNHLARVSLSVREEEGEEEKQELRFEHGFDEAEELDHVHEAICEGPATELIALEDGGAAEEATAIARHLASALAMGRYRVRDEGDGGVRAARPSDVALLLPRFTHVDAYLRAFEEVGLPYVVIKGRGLLSTVEARDVLALARVVAAEDDGRGIASVLRGPMVGLSDDALVALGNASEGGFRTLLSDPPPASVLPRKDERERYASALALLRRLRANVDRVGLSEALKIALQDTGYVAILGGLPSGRQRMANVDRIVHELAERERRGEDGRAVLHELVRRSADDGDREADVATEGADVVRVMTVHQSKGLQFPIVVAADLGRLLRVNKAPIEYDRHPDAGLALAVRAPWGKWLYAPHHDRVHALRDRRERAERMRLFYVQTTRARDRLLLAGVKKKGSILSQVIEPEVEALASAGLLEEVLVGEETPPDVAAVPPPSPSPDALAAAARRARPATPKIALLEVPVTQLEDFSLCPRRFRARNVLRLPEFPEARTPPSPEIDGDVAADPRRRGTLAHAVLERVDFRHAKDEPAKALARAMDAAGAPASADLVGRLSPFVSGEYAQRLGELEPARLSRELPFSLAVDAGPATLVIEGQIDLLVDRGDEVEVLDYKVTSPRGSDPTAHYQFQLGAYAEAVRRHVGGEVPVRPKIQFLDGKARLPVVATAPDLSAKLPALGEALIEARQNGFVEGREEPVCRAMGCGYVWLCHSSK